MPADYAHKIVQLAQPLWPVEQPGAQDWACLEEELGVSLPPDYKTLVTALGSGQFGAGLRLQNPVSSSEYTRLSAAALGHYRQTVAFLEDTIGIAFFPQPEGLILIGGIDREQLFLGPDQGRSKYSQLLLLEHDLDEIHQLKMSVSQFIYELYHGRILEPWAQGLRKSVWADDTTPFFQSRPGMKTSRGSQQ